jgi:hypothetical protein
MPSQSPPHADWCDFGFTIFRVVASVILEVIEIWVAVQHDRNNIASLKSPGLVFSIATVIARELLFACLKF